MTDQMNNTAAHLEAARKRGRRLLAGEGEAGRSYELLHASSAARDGAIVLFALWMILLSAGLQEHGPAILFAAAIAFAIYSAAANTLAVAAQLRYWESELQRERDEIRREPQQEREEVRALYEAKGFNGQILEQIVDTLCADEDRLLKVMLEEELGIFLEQSSHPVLIGALTGVASLTGAVIVAAAAVAAPVWGTALVLAILLAIVSILRTGGAAKPAIESLARWGLTAGTIAGLAYLLGEWIGGAAG